MKRKTLLLNAAILTALVAAPAATAQSKWPIFNGSSQSGDAMTIDPSREGDETAATTMMAIMSAQRAVLDRA